LLPTAYFSATDHLNLTSQFPQRFDAMEDSSFYK